MSPRTLIRCIASIALLSGLGLTSGCISVSVTDSDSPAEDIVQVEKARFQSWMNKDTAALKQVIADDVVYCHSTGICQNKQELIAFITASDSTYRAMDVVEMKPTTYGDTVVINGKLDMKVESGGKLQQFQGIYTDVYVKRDGRWQLVRWQSTRLP